MASSTIPASRIVILDNGAHAAKVGYASATKPLVMPNCVMKAKSERRRAFIGDQIDECRDLSELYYLLPFQKGYLVNFETQKRVWDWIFGKDKLKVEFEESGLIITEPILNFPSIANAMNEILFEDYEFDSVIRIPAPDLVAQLNENDAFIIVDAGYSFTHILPYYKRQRIEKGVLRIDMGGKILTNHLKEIISYRQINVLDETYVINHVKEDACYVSLDFPNEVKKAAMEGKGNSEMYRDYVLPDFLNSRRGWLRSKDESTGKPSDKNEQLIGMHLERISVPELLFHPSYLPGQTQKGICEGILESIALSPPEFHPALMKHVSLIGGCALFPNFVERVRKDLRSLLPDHIDCTVKGSSLEKVLTYPWFCGQSLALDEAKFQDFSVTRQEYLEWGNQRVNEHFLENVVYQEEDDWRIGKKRRRGGDNNGDSD